MMSPSECSEILTSSFPIHDEKGKGGEKRMASEWEELEKLSKEELIIELVKERTIHRQMNREIRSILNIDYPEDRVLPVYDDDGDDGEATTDEWARRVILHAYSNAKDVDYFDVDAIRMYGMDSDQFDRVFEQMASEGLVDYPVYDPRSGKYRPGDIDD